MFSSSSSRLKVRNKELLIRNKPNIAHFGVMDDKLLRLKAFCDSQQILNWDGNLQFSLLAG